jgi:NAD(P)-dependent dehydrogenase (short-subunit alcohol dehydrogenase family)
MNAKLLDKKVAIITGASSGIGKSAALLFSQHGAKIVLADIDEAGGNKVKDEIINAGGEAIFVKADTSNPDDSKKTVDKAKEAFGRLDIAVNNAGVAGESAPVGDYSIESWNKTIAINLSGVFYGMHYQIPTMLETGGGAVVNIASILGKVGFATSSAYVAAKHGVVGLSKTAALEYSSQGVRINSVGPGFIKTPLLENNLDKEAMEQIAGMHPIGRMGEANEVAELILWLSSDKASFVTGSYHAVDGGYLAQ